ncbi:MAG: tetratricopeptide repeat protein [Candidatus Solibacter sp.]|nr:tetratricopeptide repeat protein [Candidatus Solibacter sp.]
MQPSWTDEEVYLIAERACELAMQGRYEHAHVLFEGLAAAAPANVYARRSLAAIQIRLGRHADALATLDANPATLRDARSRQLRFEALLALGRLAEAAAEFPNVRSHLDPPAARRFALLLEAPRQ